MINLDLTKEQAIAFLMMLEKEQDGYTYDPVCVPARIVAIRALMVELDGKLDELVAAEAA